MSESNAIDEPGLFGNRNTVCAPKIPKWQTTIDRLQGAFPKYDSGLKVMEGELRSDRSRLPERPSGEVGIFIAPSLHFRL